MKHQSTLIPKQTANQGHKNPSAAAKHKQEKEKELIWHWQISKEEEKKQPRNLCKRPMRRNLKKANLL